MVVISSLFYWIFNCKLKIENYRKIENFNFKIIFCTFQLQLCKFSSFFQWTTSTHTQWSYKWSIPILSPAFCGINQTNENSRGRKWNKIKWNYKKSNRGEREEKKIGRSFQRCSSLFNRWARFSFAASESDFSAVYTITSLLLNAIKIYEKT